MFPIRDENPTLRAPVVTFALVLVNVVVWLGVQGLGTEPAFLTSLCHHALIPADLLGRLPPHSGIPFAPGAVCSVDGTGDEWTLLSSMFMHGGWLHLIGNMWFLWVFGNNVEDVLGRVRFAVFYLLCGGASACAQIVSDPDSIVPMVGASGAIGGVMGAYVVLYPRVAVDLLVVLGFYVRTIRVPAYLMLGYWFLLQVLGGLPSLAGSTGPGVAFWAHVGGFAAGAVFVRLFANPELLRAHKRSFPDPHAGGA